MTTRTLLRSLTVGAVALAACGPASAARLTRVADGFDRALLIQAPSGDNRLFVVEQRGTIRIVRANGSVAAQPFLDVTGLVTPNNQGTEQGLLGLAFHPNYGSNGKFYVNYTNRQGSTVVAEFRVSANRDVANAASRRRLLRIGQPYSNHNGGMIAFGADGFLYVGMGDGGSGGDPGNRSQNLKTMLGKMLRIDVNGSSAGRPYRIPTSNPFRGRRGVPPEIFALGLRNPWRFSFDRTRGDAWIADVGQNAIEEVDYVTRAGLRAANFGWKRFEGRSRFSGVALGGGRLVHPVAQYTHGGGRCSITGGYVYRGPSIPGLNGRYVYGDFCTGQLWSMRAGPNPGNVREITGTLGQRLPGGPRGFGEGGDGRLYVAAGGSVWRFDP